MISKPVLECVYRSLSIEEAAMWSAFEVPLMWRGFAAAVACDPRRRHSKARFRGCPATGPPNNMFFLGIELLKQQRKDTLSILALIHCSQYSK